MTASIRVASARHSFPGFELGPIDLEASSGEIHVLLGANGAGKTTLLELVCGLRRPSSGRIGLEGRPLEPDDATRFRRIGWAPDGDDTIPPELTATELWDLCAVLHGRIDGDVGAMTRRAGFLADRLHFDPPPRPLGEYSHGMRRKAQLVAALLHDPPVIVLDEPTNGLDQVSAYILGLLLEERAHQGAVALVGTHDLMWTMRFAHRLSVMSGGVIKGQGTPVDIVGDSETVEAVGEMYDRFVDEAGR